MWAGLRLRLLEARRRGGLWLLLAAVVAVSWIALFGGETQDGRYGLATDVAAALAYVAAIFYGAFPLAIDRERKRAYVPGASPVAPWSWALGNALGGAAVGFTAGVVLFATAGLASAFGGGIETHAVTRIGKQGTHWLRVPLQLTVPDDATKLRLLPRVQLIAEDKVGTTDAASIEIGGRVVSVFPGQPVVIAVQGPKVLLRNLSADHMVGFDLDKTRTLTVERSFSWNAMAAGIGPALGAAALAAFGAAAGANLTAPVAALLVAVVLTMASLKGFLLDTLEHGGSTKNAMAAGGHSHGASEHVDVSAAQAIARGFVGGLLLVLPDLSDLDRTGRVALGEWTGTAGAGVGVLLLLGALALAGALGGIGVYSRRLP